MSKVLHIAINRKSARNKFVPDFHKLLTEEGVDNDFLYIGDSSGIDVSTSIKIYPFNIISSVKLALKSLKYKKIILHSLPPSLFVLFLMPFIIFTKKFFLIVWGGEIHHQQYNKKTLSSRIGDFIRYLCLRTIWGVITDIDGDYEIIRSEYKNKGIRVDLSCVYPSNIFYEVDEYRLREQKDLKVLIGASAAKRNNHQYILNIIRDIPFPSGTTFICPLSYGDKNNAKVVEKEWRDIFGMNFHPIFEFMDIAEYRKLLADIDIALFAFDGQQALGNIRNLLGFGCKVYLRKSSVAFQHFHNHHIDVYDIDEFIDYKHEINEKNSEIVKALYSYNNTAEKIKKFLLS